MSDAEDFLNSYKLLSASVTIGDLGDAIEVVDGKLNDIHDGLSELQEVDSLHRKAVEDVDNTIREINQQLLSQNYSFGPSSDKLEDKLSNIKGVYEEFVLKLKMVIKTKLKNYLVRLTT